MKRIIIIVCVVGITGFGIAYTLKENKASNQAKVDVVNKGIGVVPVRISEAKKETIDLNFAVNGKLAPDQDLQLISEVNGRILSIKVKEGDRVSKGQVLATVESTFNDLNLKTAQEALAKLKIDQERLQKSLKTGGVTQAQVDEINLAVQNTENQVAQAQKLVSDAHIKAPISGIINSRSIEVGSFVGIGTPLFNIVDVSSLKLKVTANERQAVQLEIGSKVSVKVPVFQDEEFTGTVSFIAPKADNSLNYPVEIRLDNTKKNKLKAGMYATADFQFAELVPMLTIPRAAFVDGVNSGKIFVVEKQGTASVRKVATGSVIGEKVEILNGLKEGEIVITTGQINLINGSPIEVIQ